MSVEADATAPGHQDAAGDGAPRRWARAAPALSAGLMLAFSSSFGQTYFLALFGGVWREAFALSHGAFGALYALATLVSAACLFRLGALADTVRPSRLAPALLVATALAALGLASATHVIGLALALMAMRLLGQGLLSHVAMTTMAKWFSARRGRALGVAMLGFPLGEAILPALATGVMAAFGWRAAWVGVAALAALVLAPVLAVLARRAEATASKSGAPNARAGGDAPASWRRHDAVRDWRFYALAPGLLATPFIITSVLFHQAHLADAKGWTLTAFAGLFPLYAVASTVAGLVVGRLVDRVGTPRVAPYSLAPLIVGLAWVSMTDAFAAAAAMMVLMGATAGATTIMYTSIWSELYGPAHVGAIRAVAVSAMVVSSALGPAVTGAGLDAGVGLDAQLRVLSLGAAACALSLVVLQTALTWREPPPCAPTASPTDVRQ